MVIIVSNARLNMNNVQYDEVVAVEHELPIEDPAPNEEQPLEEDQENDQYAPLSPPGENRINNQEDVDGGFDNEIVQLENNNNIPNDEPPPEYDRVARQPLDDVELQRWRNLRDELAEFQNGFINNNLNHRLNPREQRYMPFSPADTPSSSNSPNRELEISDEELEPQPSASGRNNYLHDMFAREIGDLRLADRLTRKRKNGNEGNEPPCGKRVHFGGISDVIEPGTRKRKSTEKHHVSARKHKRDDQDSDEGCSTSSYQRKVFSKKRDSPDDDDDQGQGFGGSSQQNDSVIEP